MKKCSFDVKTKGWVSCFSKKKNIISQLFFFFSFIRFELDLVIESNASTIHALEPVLKLLQETKDEIVIKAALDSSLDGEFKRNQISVKTFFFLLVLCIRSIERIYGQEKGPDIIEALFTNPVVVVPIVYNRLKAKDQEWTKARREWNKAWREVNEKNYYKSLDYQSLNFKTNDKKFTNTKGKSKKKYIYSLY